MTETRQDKTEQTPAPLRLYKTQEAADMWGISYWILRKLIIEGKIRPVVGMGKGWMFDGTEFKQEILERL